MAGLLLRLLLFVLFLGGLVFAAVLFLSKEALSLVVAGVVYAPLFLTLSFLFTVFMLFPLGFLFGFSAGVILLALVPIPWVKYGAIAFLIWLCYSQFLARFTPKKWTHQEVEDAIIWAKVGPEEMPLVEKLRTATADFQISAIAKQLARRDVLQLPDAGDSYGIGDFFDDWRVYAGILIKLLAYSTFHFFGFVTIIFGAVYLSGHHYLGLPADIGDFKNSGTMTYSVIMLVLAMGVGVVCGYFGWGIVDTSSWKDLIIGWMVLIACQVVVVTLWLFLLLPIVWPILQDLLKAAGY